jgi:HEAT repeat protein
MGRCLTTTGLILLGSILVPAGCGLLEPRPAFEQMTPAEQILSFEATGVQVEGADAALQKLLRDRSPVIQAQAAQWLAARAADGRPDVLLPALTHADPLVRGIAQTTYIEYSPYGMAPVVSDGKVIETSPQVLDALARLDDPYGRVDLERVIRDRRDALREGLDTDPQTAVLAADVLARIGDAGARRRVLELIDTAPEPVLAKAVRSCVRDGMAMGPTVLPLAFERGVATRRAVMRALVVSPDPRLQSLLVRGLRDRDEAVRRNAIRALGNLGAAAPIDLLARMLDGSGGEAADALQALGVIGLPAADVLREYIARGEGGPALQVRAMMALAPNAERRDIPWAAQRLESEDPYIRAAAASVLGRIGHPEAQAALVARIDDAEPLVRASVAKALGQIGTIYAANHLVAMLDDPSPLVVAVAAWGCGATGYPETVPALVELMTSHRSGPDVPVRIGEMYGRPELAATEALGRIRSEAAREALRKALGDESWWIRAVAAGGLKTQAERAEATLAALALRLDDPVNLVRAKALLALGALGQTYAPGAFQTE